MENVVVIGGGTGTFVTLSALKAIPNLDISAIVTVADSGGSTGRLRDEFGFLPVGDLRQALAALAQENGKSWIRDLLLYRFSKGHGLEGHNLGNLILTALQDITGSTAKAVEIASKIFRLHGHIYPITTKSIQLVIEYEGGKIETGEHTFDEPEKHGGERIVSLKTFPLAHIYSKARDAILKADILVISPGDLYGSIMPNLIIEGASATIAGSKAKLVYIMNLMTRYTQTHGMTASDHLAIIEKHTKHPVDAVIINTAPIPKKILLLYEKQKEFPVVDDLKHVEKKLIIRANLIRAAIAEKQKGDRLSRSYLRHDAEKLRQVLEGVLR